MDWSHGKSCPGCRRSDWRKSGGGMFLYCFQTREYDSVATAGSTLFRRTSTV